MALPFILMAAGTATKILGQWQANLQQANAELENQKFYEEQAQYAKMAADRSANIAAFDYTAKIGQQTTDYAASGIDTGSGSASVTIGGTVANAIEELFAIKKKGEMDFKLARARANRSGETAALLSSPGYNLVQAGTTLIGDYAATGGYGKKA